MFNRLTNPDKNYECRLFHCEAEEWMYSIYGEYPSMVIDENEIHCNNCPFIKIVNKLAKYEDKEYNFEDDLK